MYIYVTLTVTIFVTFFTIFEYSGSIFLPWLYDMSNDPIAIATITATSFVQQLGVKNFSHHLQYVKSEGWSHEFLVIWSKPQFDRPVATAVVKQTVYVSGKASAPTVTYRIENERVHHPSENLQFSEQWLETVIRNKLRIKAQFDVKTKFDTSRILISS